MSTTVKVLIAVAIAVVVLFSASFVLFGVGSSNSPGLDDPVVTSGTGP